jgi:signal transduction histidine kinase
MELKKLVIVKILLKFIKKKLGYPLNALNLNISTNQIPELTSRSFLHTLLVLTILLLIVGLWIIYRSVISEVSLAQKRQDFVSAVTHELRTPLTTIQLYSEMLEKDMVKDPDRQKNYYQFLSKETGRLSRLVENVLQMARLEKNTFNLILKKENPNAVFDLLKVQLSDLASRKGFNLVTDQRKISHEINLDAEALQQIFFTLMENSIKFGKESRNKDIIFKLTEENNKVVWSLADFGPGIPESEFDKVFDKFYRVENELTRKTKGTGIGLSMVKMLSVAMNTKIKLEKNNPTGIIVKIIFEYA